MTKLTDVASCMTRKLVDYGQQYDAFLIWLKDNQLTTDDLPVRCQTDLGEDIKLDCAYDVELSSDVIFVVTSKNVPHKKSTYLSNYIVFEQSI